MAPSETPARRGAASRPANLAMTQVAPDKARDAGWSQRRLARLIGQSDTYAGHLFKGQSAMDLGLSPQLAGALGLSLDQLFRPAHGVGEAQSPFQGAHSPEALEDDLLAAFRAIAPHRRAEALERLRPVLESFAD